MVSLAQKTGRGRMGVRRREEKRRERREGGRRGIKTNRTLGRFTFALSRLRATG